jgi:hypothetical protein
VGEGRGQRAEGIEHRAGGETIGTFSFVAQPGRILAGGGAEKNLKGAVIPVKRIFILLQAGTLPCPKTQMIWLMISCILFF